MDKRELGSKDLANITLSIDMENLVVSALENGLLQARNYRLNLLSREERSIQAQLDQKAHVYPETLPPLVIRGESRHKPPKWRDAK